MAFLSGTGLAQEAGRGVHAWHWLCDGLGTRRTSILIMVGNEQIRKRPSFAGVGCAPVVGSAREATMRKRSRRVCSC